MVITTRSPDDYAAQAITHGPTHHFCSYFNIQPWDMTDRYLLCLEVPFRGRQPEAGSKATVGMVDSRSLEFIPLSQTTAWNFQQAAMMHWLPNSNSEIIFNDREGERFVSVILNVHNGDRRVLPRPISAISHDGRTGLSLNFARLQWARPGYGYAGGCDPYSGICYPLEEGIHSIDLNNGEERRVVSLWDITRIHPGPVEMRRHAVFFNHTLFSKDDSKFAFLVEWRQSPFPKWARIWRLGRLWRLKSAMFSVAINGDDLHHVVDYGMVSHFDWRGSRDILVWARIGYDPGYYLIHSMTPEAKIVGEGILTEDGHCSFSPDGRWILTDTYPDHTQHSALKLFDWENGTVFVLGRYYNPPPYDELRCDLHPSWNRKGTIVSFSSIHEGSQQIYMVDVSRVTKG